MTKASKKFDVFFYFKPTQETSLGRGGNFLKWEGGNNLRIIPILKGIILQTYHFVMNRKRKGIQFFIVLSIFSFFLTYLLYLNYINTEFPSSKPKFENSDQDYLLDNQQNNLEISKPNAFTLIAETSLFVRVFLFFQNSYLDPQIIILRCWENSVSTYFTHLLLNFCIWLW